MSDLYNMPTCSTYGDVVGFCSCIEQIQDGRNRNLRVGKECFECHDEGLIVEVVYGSTGEKMRVKYERGEIKLGRCTISEDNLDWHNNKYDYEWSRAEHEGCYNKQ